MFGNGKNGEERINNKKKEGKKSAQVWTWKAETFSYGNLFL